MKKIIVLLAIFFISGSLVSAQTSVFAPPGVEEQLSTTITPETPGANTDVSIFIQSFSTDLNKAYIIWSKNGTVLDEGTGRNRFNFTTGNLGTVTTIRADIQTIDGRAITRTFSFEPAEVSLVYEALTYTPPFYKGKPVFIPQAAVKVVAFPDFTTSSGVKIAPENLTYTWRSDGKVLQSASGYGKQQLIIDGSIIPRPMNISVEVTASGSRLKATNLISISPEKPEVIFYEDNLILGPLWNRGYTNDLYLSSKEIKLRAEPYFLSVWTADDPSLSYTWRVGGNTISQAKNNNSLGLRNESEEEGSTRVSLNIDVKDKILQSIQNNLFIQFTRPQ